MEQEITRANNDRPQRIAWFSAVGTDNNLRSAEFTAELLPALSRSYQIDVFTDDQSLAELNVSRPESDRTSSFHHAVSYYLQARATPYDLHVYQVEDHLRCDLFRWMARLQPGIVFAHDLIFCDPLAYLELGKDENIYLTPETLANSVVVVGSEKLCRELKTISESELIAVSGFPIRSILPEEKVNRNCVVRDTLQIPRGALILGFAGCAPVRDRVFVTLEAYSRLESVLGSYPVHFIWLVSSASEEREAQAILSRARDVSAEVKAKLHITVAHQPSQLMSYLAALDVFSFLRFDRYRGIPLEVYGALASNVPLIVSEYGAFCDLPTKACFKVPVGDGESEVLEEALRVLCRSKELRENLARVGQDYVENSCDPAMIKLDFDQIVKRYQMHLRNGNADTKSAYQIERKRLLRDLIDSFGPPGLPDIQVPPLYQRAICDFFDSEELEQ